MEALPTLGFMLDLATVLMSTTFAHKSINVLNTINIREIPSRNFLQRWKSLGKELHLALHSAKTDSRSTLLELTNFKVAISSKAHIELLFRVDCQDDIPLCHIPNLHIHFQIRKRLIKHRGRYLRDLELSLEISLLHWRLIHRHGIIPNRCNQQDRLHGMAHGTIAHPGHGKIRLGRFSSQEEGYPIHIHRSSTIEMTAL